MTKKLITPRWVILCPQSGMRYCTDGKYREHATFGSFPGCVKLYKSRGWALRIAQRRQCPHNKGNCTKAYIVSLYPGDAMDAAGVITRHDGKVLKFLCGSYIEIPTTRPIQHVPDVSGVPRGQATNP